MSAAKAPTPPCKLLTPQISWPGKEPVLSIDVSNASGFVATGGADSMVNVWRIGRPAALLNLAAHTSAVACVDFDHREERVASGIRGQIMSIRASAGTSKAALAAKKKMAGRAPR